MTDHELGVFGELMAQKQLKEDGYHIKQTNFRYLKYEIDIVAEKGEELIIVEVKTRQTAEIGEPWIAVTKKKQRQIIQCANFYIQSRGIQSNVRFDIMSIVHNNYRTKIEHIIDAFST
jgi:putative endonuclease|uniref:YraN family protein n=1 Tax=Fluviicola sp. TaxID=1917219 RepID=UPI00404B507E